MAIKCCPLLLHLIDLARSQISLTLILPLNSFTNYDVILPVKLRIEDKMEAVTCLALMDFYLSEVKNHLLSKDPYLSSMFLSHRSKTLLAGSPSVFLLWKCRHNYP
jgi:hypothetical protein